MASVWFMVGHIISLCRALSYNGLGNALWLTAIHGGSHTNPSFVGDTIYCQSTITAIEPVQDRDDIALIRMTMLGIKNNNPEDMDYLTKQLDGRKQYHQDVVLELDYSVVMMM